MSETNPVNEVKFVSDYNKGWNDALAAAIIHLFNYRHKEATRYGVCTSSANKYGNIIKQLQKPVGRDAEETLEAIRQLLKGL